MQTSELSGLSIAKLFSRLNGMLKDFVSNIEDVIGKHNEQASINEIKEVIEYIRKKAPTDEKDKQENMEMLKLLNQLVTDKNILEIIKLEGKEWLSLIDAIEERAEKDKGYLRDEELGVYNDIKNGIGSARDMLRKD